MFKAWLVAKSVLIEAIRRKEIYAIVMVSAILIAAIMTINFFGLRGLAKFYREIAYLIMGTATALTVVVLSARQLPREFESRTIHPLLAKPISRAGFLLGKLVGVMLAATFCYFLFMLVFMAGSLYLGAPIHLAINLQYVYLQLLMMLVLSTLSFWLSLVVNLDAAITLGVLFYGTSSMITSASSLLYDLSEGFARNILVLMNYILPHLSLFDLSSKAIHADHWPPLSLWVIGKLSIYALVFAGIYFSFALFCFRRKPL